MLLLWYISIWVFILPINKLIIPHPKLKTLLRSFIILNICNKSVIEITYYPTWNRSCSLKIHNALYSLFFKVQSQKRSALVHTQWNKVSRGASGERWDGISSDAWFPIASFPKIFSCLLNFNFMMTVAYFAICKILNIK